MFDIAGKVAVITGGAGILGSDMSRHLAAAGARVAILDRRCDLAEQLAAEIINAGGDAICVEGDVLDKGVLQQSAKQTLDTYGRVDILINAAGGNKADGTTMPGERTFFDLPEDALQWVFNLNFMGTLLTSQVFGEIMANQQSGVILNISSMSAFRPLTRVVAYSAAKTAVNNFTQWLAVYLATEHGPNIRVNALAPGFFLTKQNHFLLVDETNGDLTARGQSIIDHTPMARFGEPADLLGTVQWLISDASRFVTGTVIPVDGGFSAYAGV
jgi:NAD(P)-dependent dehydrogenase (short-subunit alcohol dehydrogenase family)